MTEIKVLRNVLEANQQVAEENRRRLREHGIFCLNFISSPGAGKTSVLEKTIAGLCYTFRFACIEGDIAGEQDAKRLARLGVPAVQINTEGGCHLSAAMVKRALDELDLGNIDILAIENVGNLVCPASFDLGESLRFVLLSVPEGDDKPRKYPEAFITSQVFVITKCDLLPYLSFDVERVIREALEINPRLEIFRTSAVNGAGVEELCAFLGKKLKELRGPNA